jgi:ATP-dependent Lon protease
MEVIEFPGYIEEEKVEIARQFLIPRQISQHGLLKAGLRFEDEALQKLIQEYTYESGVRNLERQIASICRKSARRLAERKRYAKRISGKQVTDLLGAPKFSRDRMREEDEVGVVTGVAWTPTGGDIMSVEINLMPGKGSLTLTGQLGDVMQESAKAAWSYTRSQAQLWDISEETLQNTDIHIHIPEGSVPKDGPSAGVTLVTALISAFTNRPVRRDVGMTGEVTIRGRVLPVGGLREKALACRRAGITTFIMPEKNQPDLEDIPDRLRQDLKFIMVSRVTQVLDAALLLPMSPASGRVTTGKPPVRRSIAGSPPPVN